jgi:hypothetical protein
MTRLVPSLQGMPRMTEAGVGRSLLPSALGHTPLATPMSLTADAVLHCSCGVYFVGSDWRVASEMDDHLTDVKRRSKREAVA